MKTPLVFLISVCLFSCSSEQTKPKTSNSEPINRLEIQYAKGFSVNYFEDCKELLVFSADGKDTLHTYYLANEHRKGYLKTPVTKLASLSSVYAAYIDVLDLAGALVAVDEKDYINAASINAEFNSREIAEVGSLDKLNFENVLVAEPELLYTFGWQGESSAFESKLPNTSFAYSYEYLEEHPLGRAEWVKFFACFFDKERQADSIFNQIKYAYEDLERKTLQVQSRPKVLINMPFNEQWHLPGGLSFSTQLIRDAGAFYPWESNQSKESTPLDFEVVFNQAFDCDFWINAGVFSSYDQVLVTLPDMALFNAFKNKQVFNNNARTNLNGGNDYWESGSLHVDEVLADLISIFHPDLLPNHTLKYYKPLVNE